MIQLRYAMIAPRIDYYIFMWKRLENQVGYYNDKYFYITVHSQPNHFVYNNNTTTDDLVDIYQLFLRNHKACK